LSHPDTAPATIQIFDSQGKLIYQKQISGVATEFFPAEIFPARGVYFYKIGEDFGKLVYAP
jgi:hypothetical protein